MKKKLLIFIMLAIISLGGMVMVFSLNREIKAAKAVRTAQEEKRNREYEESLVKALKNSYRDLEEIQISGPGYSDKPGNWSCTVQLKFTDGQLVKYGMGHRLGATRNKSAVSTLKEANILHEHYGETDYPIKIIYSNGEETIE